MRNSKEKKVRLPLHFRPERYKISLHPDLEKASFAGEEVIEFRLSKSEDKIILHSDELTIRAAEVKIEEKTFKASKISYDRKSETVIFSFPRKLPKGKGELSITFDGVLNSKMRGFYRSRYEIGGKEYFMATTQFEPTHARYAFPCVDEPAVKAVFDVTLIIPKDHTAISNTIPSAVREHESGYQMVDFVATPKMSTYLVAFIVGKFEWVEKETTGGTMVRVFVTPGKKKQADFALQVAVKALAFYENYFGIKYPLPVLDMIAIPDFASGAMENWGAVTYRETAILFDADKSSTASKQWIALVIAHELAHQWFGNLVTMEWWTHLWLNEGFASYIEYLAVDKIFPEWDIWTQFVHSDLGQAMSLDSLRNTHPIEVTVHHPSEIGEIFDAVSYSKGASVLRMLADYLGEKNFRDGLRRYLKKHSYSNASTENLWSAFEHVSGLPVKVIMDNWTKQAGFPVIKIEEGKKTIKLTQSRFLSSSLERRKSEDKTVWRVPMNIRRASVKKIQTLLLDKKSKPINMSLKTSEWASFNAGTSGMYRLDYPTKMLESLEAAVKHKAIPARDRFSIQDDAFALAESGETSVAPALELAQAYKYEDDYTVWASLAANLKTVESLISEEKYLESYFSYLRDIFGDVAKKVGWEAKKNEKHTDPMLRSLALLAMGHAGDKETIKKASGLFNEMKKGKVSLNPDLKGVVYALVAKNGGRDEYEWFMKRHQTEELPEEKNRLLYSLARFKNEELIKRTLEYSFSKNVRAQDTPAVFSHVGDNRSGADLAWEFTKANWDEILERYGKGGHILPRMVKPAVVFTTKSKAEDIKKFFKTHEAPGAERAIEQVVEKIYSNADWLKRDKNKIRVWLKKNSY